MTKPILIVIVMLQCLEYSTPPLEGAELFKNLLLAIVMLQYSKYSTPPLRAALLLISLASIVILLLEEYGTPLVSRIVQN